MKLWLLKPLDASAKRASEWNPTLQVDVWTWDCAYGFVVRAKDEEEARSLASKMCGDEGRETWLDAKMTSCQRLEARGQAEVVLRDFVAG